LRVRVQIYIKIHLLTLYESFFKLTTLEGHPAPNPKS